MDDRMHGLYLLEAASGTRDRARFSAYHADGGKSVKTLTQEQYEQVVAMFDALGLFEDMTDRPPAWAAMREGAELDGETRSRNGTREGAPQ